MRTALHAFLASGRLLQLVLIPWLLGAPTACAVIAARIFADWLPLDGAWDWCRLVFLVLVTWLAGFLLALVAAFYAGMVLIPASDALRRWLAPPA